MINNPDWGTMNEKHNNPDRGTLLENDWFNRGILLENHDRNYVNVFGNMIILPKFCPLYYECRKELQHIEPKENEMKQNISIPLIIHQYLLNENNTRYTRLNVMNQ
eukprot:217178_1